jgi:hypothetical protein
MKQAEDDEVRELALKLVGVCARERGDLNHGQLYLALALCMIDVVRSCSCPRCRDRILRHVRVRLPKELNKGAGYARDKYLGACWKEYAKCENRK